MVRHVLAAALAMLVSVACGSGNEAPVSNEAPGPPEVRADVVAEHAAQLDEELGARPAGSQQEQIASQYVLGHLQKAGYLVRLDAVPVGNLVESSNLLALPPSENDPAVVVVAPYDSPEDRPAGGEEAGFLLELARALNVSSPDHDIEFGALGAESVSDSQELLGSRRLVRLLLDEDLEPRIVSIGDVGEGLELSATGDLASEVLPGSADSGEDAEEDSGVFQRAGLEHATVSGDVAELGAALLDYLEQAGG